MSLKDCLEQGLKAGIIDAEYAQQALDLFDELVDEYGRTIGPGALAAYKASFEVAEQVKIHLLQRRKQRLLVEAKRVELDKFIDNHKNHKGDLSATEAARLIFSATGKASGMLSLNARFRALRGQSHAMVEEILSKHRRTLLGNRRDKAGLTDLVRASFGEKTGNAAADEMAGAWHQVSEMLRRKFNAAGGHIGKIDNYGLPQAHDYVKVRLSTVKEWIDYTLPLLDRDLMIDGRTGKPFTAGGLRFALDGVYQNIKSKGAVSREAGDNSGRSLGNQRSDHRFLQFKDVDAWLAYQEKFGNGDPFDTMMNHIDGMSRDIAAMQTLGPSPDNMVKWIGDKLDNDLLRGDEAGKVFEAKKSKVNKAKFAMNGMYQHFMGTENGAVNSKIASGFQNVRQGLVAAQLGRAIFSAITDIAFSAVTAKFNGLKYGRMFKQHLKFLNPRNKADQKVAIRLGLIADEASQVAASSARYAGEIAGNETMKRISDFVLRSTGLAPWTQAGKWAFGMEFLGHLGDDVGKNFNQLDEALQEAMQRYGINAGSWDVIRKTPLMEHKGATFLDAANIANRIDLPPNVADDLATRVLAMVQTETDFAIPSTVLEASGVVPLPKSGTVLGEVSRSMMMYKSFPISIMFTHMARIGQINGFGNKAAYAARLFILTTVTGGLALQLKDISKGRDPRPVNTPEFWGQAILQGGGFGIFGDFITQDTSRYGQNLGTTIAGPVVGFASDVLGVGRGFVNGLFDGDVSDTPADLIELLGKYTPGSSAWYAAVEYKRLVIEQLEMMVDPKAKKKFGRRVKSFEKNKQQPMWWKSGQIAPDHAPDLTNLVRQ